MSEKCNYHPLVFFSSWHETVQSQCLCLTWLAAVCLHPISPLVLLLTDQHRTLVSLILVISIDQGYCKAVFLTVAEKSASLSLSLCLCRSVCLSVCLCLCLSLCVSLSLSPLPLSLSRSLSVQTLRVWLLSGICMGGSCVSCNCDVVATESPEVAATYASVSFWCLRWSSLWCSSAKHVCSACIPG